MDRRSLLAGMGTLGACALGGRAVAAQAPFSAMSVAEGPPVVIAQSYVMRSQVLGESRAINVYLPPGYAQISRQTYPVLYLLDGGELEDFLHISGLVQVGSTDAFTREMIVVGVADSDRARDFTSLSADPRDKEEFPTGGGSGNFRRFLAEELQPWVAGMYRTSGERALIGESLAGLFVTETLLKAPALFDTYIAVSPSLWWDSGSLARAAPAALKALPPGPRRLWLTMGAESVELQAGVEGLVAALKADAPMDLNWTYQPMPSERHSTIFHPAAMAALRYLYPAPPRR